MSLRYLSASSTKSAYLKKLETFPEEVNPALVAKRAVMNQVA
jgi:hypothetical protein